MNKKKINMAVIFTCHNRSEKTRACIESLNSQKTQYILKLDYYICDDGSTDDTCAIINILLPNAHIVKGDGQLFWARGMYKAMAEAVKVRHDFYLMINDDVIFENTALETMLNSYCQVLKLCSSNKGSYKLAGIVGSTLKKDHSDVSYGGWRYVRKLKIGKAELIRPNGKPQICDIANWNCFMIPEEIIVNVGIIDPFYHHSKADFDYSMMMKRKGHQIYIANDYIGSVDNNERIYSRKDSAFRKLKWLLSVKGIPPQYEFYYFTNNWGILGCLFFLYSYPKTIIHELFVKN